MNNEEKILSMLVQIQTDIKDLKQGQAKLEQGQARLTTKTEELELGLAALRDNVEKIDGNVFRIQSQQQENTRFIKALKYAVEEIDAKTTVNEVSIAKLDRLELDIAEHEGKFTAIKEAVS